MDLQRERQQRRLRNRAHKTSGVIVKTMHDARGIAEPLDRYGELIACQIVALYNAVHGLPHTSRHTLARLKQLFHESDGLPATSKILIRPDYQWRYGYNHQTIYRKAAGTSRFMLGKGILDSQTLRWVNNTCIVLITDDPKQQPSDHDAALALVMSSIEVAARRIRSLRFITHLDILRSASPDAQDASSPLSIPIPQLSHIFSAGAHVTLRDIHVKPDALFGIEYAVPSQDFRFYALEFDRSTEDVEPSKNLVRASWLRKILSYSAISAHPNPIYRTYLKIPNLLVLCIFSDTTRMSHVMRLTKQHAAYPSQFLFKTIPPVDPLLNAATMPQLFTEPWHRIGGTFDISTMQEGGDDHDPGRQDHSRQGAHQQARRDRR